MRPSLFCLAFFFSLATTSYAAVYSIPCGGPAPVWDPVFQRSSSQFACSTIEWHTLYVDEGGIPGTSPPPNSKILLADAFLTYTIYVTNAQGDVFPSPNNIDRTTLGRVFLDYVPDDFDLRLPFDKQTAYRIANGSTDGKWTERSLSDEIYGRIRNWIKKTPSDGNGRSWIPLPPDPVGGIRGSVGGLGFFESSPAWYTETIDLNDLLPSDLFQFGFNWEDPGDGDWFELLLDGKPVWSSLGLDFAAGKNFFGSFQLGDAAGGAANLTAYLHSRGDSQARFNFFAFEATGPNELTAVPLPGAATFLATSAVGLLALRRRKKGRKKLPPLEFLFALAVTSLRERRPAS